MSDWGTFGMASEWTSPPKHELLRSSRSYGGGTARPHSDVRGYIVSTSCWSDATWAWAMGTPIDLIDSKKLAEGGLGGNQLPATSSTFRN